jgi:sugar lactone lactonase YvrE
MGVLRPRYTLLVLTLLLAISAGFMPGCRRIRPLSDLGRRPAKPAAEAPQVAREEPVLVEVATSERLWTGVAVSAGGRIFVTYPRWSDDVTISVGEITGSGRVVPFPDPEWNTWDASSTPGDHLICVQSAHVDADDNLWILDPASPYLQGVVPGGAKLLKVDLDRDKVVSTIGFDETVAPAASYLNDVRVDTEKQVAYITDSGLGALIVVDLKTGKARRLLADHPSTKSERIVLTIGGKEWRIGGHAPEVHADGLALDRTGRFLYYQALTSRSLYRIETIWLLDPSLSGRALGAKVEEMGYTGPADGIEFGSDGYLYLTAVEEGAINVFAGLGAVETVVRDPRLLWPDTIARGPDGYLYVTTSQIHLGGDSNGPYRLLKFKPRG